MVGVIVVLLILVIFGAVIASSAFAARDELKAALPLTSKLESAITGADSAKAKALALEFEGHTQRAAAAVDNPIWRMGEAVPWVGANLVAIRTVADASQDLAVGAVVPAGNFPVDTLKPSNGKIDLSALTQATPLVNKASTAIDAADKQISAIDTGSLVGPVADAVKQFDTQLGKIRPLTDGLAKAMPILPAALGQEGTKHYLLLFQNNAEARAMGGNPAALLLVTVQDGVLEIGQQASSADFHAHMDLPITGNLNTVYGPVIGKIMQNITMVPDFPTVGDLARQVWLKRYGVNIDGVVSFDPVALANLVKATGPMKLESGDTLTSANAVPLLLNQVYDRYRIPADQDAYFASVAKTVFKKVTSGNQFTDLVGQLGASVEQHRLLMWSADPKIQAIIAGGPLAGTMPTTNTDTTTLGVWVNDFTFAKMDYYVTSTVAAQASCNAGPYTLSTSMKNAAPAVSQIPPYALGPIYLDGDIHTDVVLYGPVGSKALGVTVNGQKVDPAAMGEHLGRPVIRVSVTIPRGTTTTVAGQFSAVSGASPTITVLTTPGVHATPVTVKACS